MAELLESTFGRLGESKFIEFPISAISAKDLMFVVRVVPMHAPVSAYFKTRDELD